MQASSSYRADLDRLQRRARDGWRVSLAGCGLAVGVNAGATIWSLASGAYTAAGLQACLVFAVAAAQWFLADYRRESTLRQLRAEADLDIAETALVRMRGEVDRIDSDDDTSIRH